MFSLTEQFPGNTLYEFVYVHPCRMKDVFKCVCVYYVCVDDEDDD